MYLEDGREIFCKLHQERSYSAEKHTVVLMHGGPGESCISFQMCISALVPFVNVIEIDQRGCGRSECPFYQKQ